MRGGGAGPRAIGAGRGSGATWPCAPYALRRRAPGARGAESSWSTDDLPNGLALSPEGREVWSLREPAAHGPRRGPPARLDRRLRARAHLLPARARAAPATPWERTPDERQACDRATARSSTRLLIDLSWASNLEGNTYSRLDTRELIRHGTAAEGKARIETQMILNHKAAIELLVDASASPARRSAALPADEPARHPGREPAAQPGRRGRVRQCGRHRPERVPPARRTADCSTPTGRR